MLEDFSRFIENVDWRRVGSFSVGVSALAIFMLTDLSPEKQSFCQGFGVLFTLYGLKFL